MFFCEGHLATHVVHRAPRLIVEEADIGNLSAHVLHRLVMGVKAVRMRRLQCTASIGISAVLTNFCTESSRCNVVAW